MLAYPQLIQFPVKKRRRERTVVNRAADGSSVRLADPAGDVTEWDLSYTDLSDAEVTSLQNFFLETEGRLRGFTFLDPTGNLLAWSEDLTNAVWQKGPWLAAVRSDSVWMLRNTGGAAQRITQTIAAPGDYLYCLSACVRSAQALDITLVIGGELAQRRAGPEWKRLSFTANGTAAAEAVLFGIEVPAGVSVDVRGIQVEAQASASIYKVSTSGGVYQNARLAEDALKVTTTGPDRHACRVKVTHANHL